MTRLILLLLTLIFSLRSPALGDNSDFSCYCLASKNPIVIANEWVTNGPPNTPREIGQFLGSVVGGAAGGTAGSLTRAALQTAAKETVASVAADAAAVVKSPPSTYRPSDVPKNWLEQAGKKDGHTKYVNPSNPHDYVRVKRDGTITQVRNGKAYDVNGNQVDLKSPEAHGITSETFNFRE
jgi:hypothetical protein